MLDSRVNLVLKRLSDLRLDFEVLLYHLLMQSFEFFYVYQILITMEFISIF